jgi:hypothetical protein
MGFSFKGESDFLGEYITVRLAAKISGYNQQYLRRLLRNNMEKSRRLGQTWLLERRGFIDYLAHARYNSDNRFGPQSKHTIATDS